MGIVAPGGYAPDPTSLVRAEALLVAQGCEVRHFDCPDARHERFAASDNRRLDGLHAAAGDPEVDLIMALRGGYGMTRLMSEIDFRFLADSGKLFIGHSDFTALHLGLLVEGGLSFAGPMICDDFTRSDTSNYTMAQLWSCLQGPEHTIVIADAIGNNDVIDLHGTLWGGNLAMLVHLIGTPWMPSIDQGILFIEDVNEHPFRIERMLMQLLYSGILDRQAAIVLGDFSGGATGNYDNGYSFETMLAFIRSRVSVPIFTGLPFGHCRDKATLAVGSQAHLHGTQRNLRLTMHTYPVLRASRGG